MTKYFVVFTEQSTKDYGYYVNAENKEDAYDIAVDRYFEMEDADSVSTSYLETVGHDVEEA